MRLRPIALLLSVVVASSACSVDATAPSSLAPPERSTMAKGGRDPGVSAATVGDRFADATTTIYTTTIDPQRRNLLRFGAHTLDIAANAICGPDSGYGLASFDRNCKSSRDPVTITATVRETASGIARIDLKPEMRFSPRRMVTLTMYVPNLTPRSPALTILYCATQTTEYCIDEAVLDPSLKTHADYGSSTVFRRIKHFSGYFVME